MAEDSPASKTCSACGETKPITAFNKRTRAKDGYQAWCRECEHSYAQARRQRVPEAERERQRRWRAADPERARAASRRQYAATADRRRASSQQWRVRNPEKVREQFSTWRAENLDHDRERNRLYRQRKPEVGRENARRRRALKVSNGEIERFTRDEIGERDDWTCGLCRLPVDRASVWPDPGAPVLDHILPLSLGGSHTRANVQIAHNLCNLRKGARIKEAAS